MHVLATPADLVREACDLLGGYLDVLEGLVAEPSGDGPAPSMRGRLAETPEPWNAAAGRALMDGHEGARRLEAALRYALNGHPGVRRGSSAANTAAALAMIPKLAAGLDPDAEAAAVQILDRWINAARCVPAIDEADRWRPVPRRACPRCGCYALRVALDARGQPTTQVACFGHLADGTPCRGTATMGTDRTGWPVLAWADGRTETAPEA